MTQKVAIPIVQDSLSSHFGQCEKFIIYTIEDGKIVKEETATPPIHTQGSHPNFLNQIGCHVIITGGMGWKAQQMMQQFGIQSIVGVSPQSPKKIIEAYLAGTLQAGQNRCEH
jgi:ATP-binding protein involved in chromosome partitioning